MLKADPDARESVAQGSSPVCGGGPPPFTLPTQGWSPVLHSRSDGPASRPCQGGARQGCRAVQTDNYPSLRQDAVATIEVATFARRDAVRYLWDAHQG